MQNLLARNLGSSASGNLIKGWEQADVEALALLPEQRLAIGANLAVMRCLDEPIKISWFIRTRQSTRGNASSSWLRTAMCYLVPFVEEEDCFFLKTVIPSCKATRDYLGQGEPSAED